MVFISTTTQGKLLEAARRQLGPDGETIVRDTTQERFSVPLEQLTYPQLPRLLAALEHDAPARAGRETALRLAMALDRLHDELEGNLSARVVAAVSRRLGPAAEPFLTTICTRRGLALTGIDRAHLDVIAESARQDATAFLGAEVGAALALGIRDAGQAAPGGLSSRICEAATRTVGREGEVIVRSICRRRLEIELDEIDLRGLSLLARAVEEDGPATIGATLTAAFAAAARQAMVSNADPLRAKIVELVTRHVGPAAPTFVKGACAKGGMPFDAVDYEHLMWLAEALRAEAQPLVGKRAADEIARGVRAILTGQ